MRCVPSPVFEMFFIGFTVLLSLRSTDADILRFTEDTCVATILESARQCATSKRIGIRMPSPDFEGTVTAKIVAGNDNEMFEVKTIHVGDFVYLQICPRWSPDVTLNRETKDEYVLNIAATWKNKGTTTFAATKVVMKLEDENDSNPILPRSYSATAYADTAVNTPILRIHAPDPDVGLNGDVYYYLLNESSFFAIHPKTGVLSVIHSLRSLRRNVTLNVAAADRAWLLFPSSRISPAPSVTAVTISVEAKETQIRLRCTPVADCGRSSRLCARCLLNTAGHSEGRHSDVDLNRCHVDLAGDQAEENCFIVTRSSSSSNQEDGVGFQVLLNDRKLAAASFVHKMRFDVVCNDGTIVRKNLSMVTVKMAPLCDVPPVEKHRHLNASEALPIGAEVGRLVDSPLPIAGPAGIGFRIIDRNGPHGPSLQQQQRQLPFTVDEHTGIVHVGNHLDYETQTHYEFDVSSDMRSCNRTFLTKVTIDLVDENDNFPIIERPVQCLQTVVSPETPVDTVLCTFRATDADSGLNGRLTFSLSVAADYEDYLFLHETSGKLYLRRAVPKAMFDRTFNVLIRCSDDGLPFRRDTSILIPFSFSKIPLMKGLKNTAAEIVMPEMSPLAANRHPPAFLDSDTTSVFVREDVSIGFVVAVVRAYDLDDGMEGFLRYYIVDGNAEGRFHIDPLTGVLTTVRQLDRETSSSYGVVVLASDAGLPPKVARKTVEVVITDSNDQKPWFDRELYVARVFENVPVGHKVLQLSARDPDTPDNGQIRYILLTPVDEFEVGTTGILQTTAMLDREATDRYDLLVQAIDSGWPPQSSVAAVTVHVLDVNDNPPRCYMGNQKVQLPEDAPPWSLVLCISAYDPDLGAAGKLAYDFHGPSNIHTRFTLDSESGCILLKRRLRYEEQHLYNFTVLVSDHGNPALSTRCYASLELLKVHTNRHPPVFDQVAVEASIFENEPPGSSVVRVLARDVDAGPHELIAYSLIGGDGAAFFMIDFMGEIRTKTMLNREKKAYYWLQVEATDSGFPPLSSTMDVFVRVLDRNDNAPIPTKPVFNGSVRENCPAGTSVLVVSASDLDSLSEPLNYTIKSGNTQSLFDINPTTGEITTTGRNIDREVDAFFQIIILITDFGSPPMSSSVLVVIEVEDENDCAPEFFERVYSFQVSPCSRKDEFLCRIAAFDPDAGKNGAVVYSLASDTTDGRIRIDARSGNIYCNGRIDNGEILDFRVEARDLGSPSRKSETEVALRFAQLPAAAAEAQMRHSLFDVPTSHDFRLSFMSKVGMSIGRFDIGDVGGVSFYVNDSDTFYVKDDLDLHLIGSVKKSFYNLTYYVTNGVVTLKRHIGIPVYGASRSSSPHFLKREYHVKLPENATIRSAVLVPSVDASSSFSTVPLYRLSSSFTQYDGKFRVDSSTGAVILQSSLDYEFESSHTLMIQLVTSNDDFAMVHLEVENVNEHQPKFSKPHYEVRLEYSTPVGANVFQFVATDEDYGSDGHLFYFIASGNEDGYFHMDANSGVMTLAKPLVGAERDCVLMVYVKDGGRPPLTDLCTLNVVFESQQNVVSFPSKTYVVSVSENAPLNIPFGQVTALGGAGLRYSLKDASGHFDICPFSGHLLVKKSLDFEHKRHYNVSVTAQNFFGYEDSVNVQISLTDCNDHAPYFDETSVHGFIRESSLAGTVVKRLNSNRALRVTAKDDDSGMAGTVTYKIAESWASVYFDVDPHTGVLFTKMELDHENSTRFRFAVLAVDHGRPQRVSPRPVDVLIEVQGINDNPPRFDQPSYVGVLYLPTAVGVRVLQLKAKDPDIDSVLKYRFSTEDSVSEEVNPFALESSSGMVTVAHMTNFMSLYFFTVVVDDGLFRDKATVQIKVLTPEMRSFGCGEMQYRATVVENRKHPQSLMVIKAKHFDRVQFSLLNPMDSFRIHPYSGVLSTTGVPLDRERTAEVQLIVQLKNLDSPSQLAQCSVVVKVEDENDCSPVFVNQPYDVTVPVGTFENSTVYRVEAVDEDEGPNGAVSYLVPKGTDSSGHEFDAYFLLNDQTGAITVKKLVEQDIVGQKMVVQVVATDHGVPPQSSSSLLRVTFVDRFVPLFRKSAYNFSVHEGPLGSFPKEIGHLLACRDERPSCGYRILAGDNYSHFHIGFKTGVLYVNKELDREMVPVYEMKVEARDWSTNASSVVDVHVTVLDVNDNAPVFRSGTYSISVPEDQPVSSRLITVAAEDADEGANSALTYELRPKHPYSKNVFGIEVTTGTVFLMNRLDFEQHQLHVLHIVCMDNGRPRHNSSAELLVRVTDVNDNPPQFLQLSYSGNVKKAVPVGFPILLLSVQDPDVSDRARLSFKIVEGNDQQLFSVKRSEGIIVTATSLSTSTVIAPTKTYHLSVSVTDGVFSATCAVDIFVDKDSAISSQKGTFVKTTLHVRVKESDERGASVAMLGNRLGGHHRILFGDTSLFSINPDSGEVVLQKKLDYETAKRHVLVAAHQLGDVIVNVTELVVDVVDENDNRPEFLAESFHLAVSSALRPSNVSVIVQFIASDADENDAVEYSIVQKKENNYNEVDKFFMLSLSGSLEVRNSVADLEGSSLSFHVKACDKGNHLLSDEVEVTIDIAPRRPDHPLFLQSNPVFEVAENAEVGTVVGVVGFTAHPQFSADIVNDRHRRVKQNFNIHPNGSLFVAGSLNREDVPVYRFYVALRDSATDASLAYVAMTSVTVVLRDINDNVPSFGTESVKLYLPEDVVVGAAVLKVHAEDADADDAGQVTYSFRGHSGPFRIESDSGWIFLAHELDRESTDHFTLNITAMDAGAPPLWSVLRLDVVVLDVNDEAPKFDHHMYNFSVETQTPHLTIVGAVHATDADLPPNNQLTYYLMEGNAGRLFAVHEDGSIYVAGSLEDHNESTATLQAFVSDGLFSDTAMVHVHLTRKKSFSCVCQQDTVTLTIEENRPTGSIVYKMANDVSEGCRFQIDNSNDFSVSDSGEITVAAALDREGRHRHTFDVVRASRTDDVYCRQRFEVNVLDVNDVAPRFTPSADYKVTVIQDRNVTLPCFLLQLHAVDEDDGYNGKVRYQLTAVDKEPFFVDATSGALFLSTKPEPKNYNVTLSATAIDQGTPPRSSTASIAILVFKTVQKPPVFSQRHYRVSINESLPLGSPVLQVSAYRPGSDGGQTGVTYHLLNESHSSTLFRINRSSGWLHVNGPLSRAAGQRSSMTVVAEDAENGLSSTAMVAIEVVDLNDHSPVFSQQFYSWSAFENTTIGSLLFSVFATDDDLGDNGILGYQLSSDTGASGIGRVLRLAPNGSFFLAAQLDREQKSSYDFAVEAFDQGAPPLTSTVLVHLEVLDVNDNSPTIQNCNSSVVAELPLDSSQLYAFKVVDLDDEGNGAPFHFQLFGLSSSHFRVTPDGVLHADFELQPVEYVLELVVRDSGFPSLSSKCIFTVRGRPRSSDSYHLSVHDLHSTVVTYLNEFPGGLVGKIHVSTSASSSQGLHFAIDSSAEYADVISVDPEDGHLLAVADIPENTYVFNVTVSGLRKSRATAVAQIDVFSITMKMLESSISVILGDVPPDRFVRYYLDSFEKALRKLLNLPASFVRIIAINEARSQSRHRRQASPPEPSSETDLLMIIRKSKHDFQRPRVVVDSLTQRIDELSMVVGLPIRRITAGLCLDSERCVRGICRDLLVFDNMHVSTLITDKQSFASPRFERKAVCLCPEGFAGDRCESVVNICAEKPCGEQMLCIVDSSDRKHHCECPNNLASGDGRCSSICRSDDCSAINFNGKSFMSYFLPRTAEIRLIISFEVRTVFGSGMLFMTAGKSDHVVLELNNGLVMLRFDFGSGEQVVRVNSPKVADGLWHHVHFSYRRNAVLLQVDKAEARTSVPSTSTALNLGREFVAFFGADVRSSLSAANGTAPKIRNGLVGCLRNVMVDNYLLPVGDSAVRLYNVRLRCEDEDGTAPSITAHSYDCDDPDFCLNGGTCIQQRGSGPACICPANHGGLHCEISAMWCDTEPCVNGGTCETLRNGYRCHCSAGYAGENCEEIATPSSPCRDSPCANDGVCIPMENGFQCNCTAGWTGRDCKQSDYSSPNMLAGALGVTMYDLLVIALVLFLTVLLAAAVICLCRWCRRHGFKKYRSGSKEMNEEILLDQQHLCNDSVRFASEINRTPPLPPRFRGFHPYRGSKLSNFEAALSTGIPTVQVRPLSMIERQPSPAKGILEAVGNYGSAAEELETLGRVSEADCVDVDPDWKVALNKMTPGSLENLKVVAGIKNNGSQSTASGPENQETVIEAANVGHRDHRSTVCNSAYYSDWASTLGKALYPVAGEVSDYGPEDEEDVSRGICKFDDTDAESIPDNSGREETDSDKFLGERFRRQYHAIRNLNEAVGSANSLNNASSSTNNFRPHFDVEGSEPERKLLLPRDVSTEVSTSDVSHICEIEDDELTNDEEAGCPPAQSLHVQKH